MKSNEQQVGYVPFLRWRAQSRPSPPYTLTYVSAYPRMCSMQVVEQHVISRGDPRYRQIDEAAFQAKNLWNAANYLVRQSFIHEGIYLNNVAVYHQIKSHAAYQALPRKVSNQVLIQLHKAWVSFFDAMQAWRDQPELFTGRPKLPTYKQGFTPRGVTGRPVNAINQLYKKHRAHQQKHVAKASRFPSRQLDPLTTKRNRRVLYYLHTASRRIIELVVAEGIGTLIIGKNPWWKQGVELGRVTNQAFVQIPHARFINLLTYKAALVGIRVVLTEESYTSQSSFLDRDPLPTYDPARTDSPCFSGRRDGRWYRASCNRLIHSDVHGAYNIARKRF